MPTAYSIGLFYIQDTSAAECRLLYSSIAGPSGSSAVQQQSTCKLTSVSGAKRFQFNNAQ